MNQTARPPDPITQNIDSITAFYTREHMKISVLQRMVETISNVAARPVFLVGLVTFVTVWIVINVGAGLLHMVAFDPPPFFWLQGIVSLLAVLTTTVVLIRQERLAKLEERRVQLDLQVNLLTEQKTTKLINLFEELRRDMPMVKDRHDPESEAMLQPTDPHRVLAEMDEARVTADNERRDSDASAPSDATRKDPAGF